MYKSKEAHGVDQATKDLDEDSRKQYMSENQRLAKTKAELENKLRTLENIHKEDTVRIEALVCDMVTLGESNKHLHSSIESKDLEIADLKNVMRAVHELRAENDAAHKDLDHCETQTAEVQDAVLKLEEEIEQTNHTIERQETQIGHIQQTITGYRKSMETSNEVNKSVLRRNQEYGKCLEESLAEKTCLLEKLRQAESTWIEIENCNKINVMQIEQLKMELDDETDAGCRLIDEINALEEQNSKAKDEILGQFV